LNNDDVPMSSNGNNNSRIDVEDFDWIDDDEEEDVREDLKNGVETTPSKTLVRQNSVEDPAKTLRRQNSLHEPDVNKSHI